MASSQTAQIAQTTQTQVVGGIEQEQLNHFLGPVQGALGGLPVAEQLQDYFLVYQQAGGTGPEIIDETAFFITYMVDSDGGVSKPLEGYPSQYNLLQNFGTGTFVIVRNDASTSLNSQLAGLHQVTAMGRQLPILYNQYGFASSEFTSSIEFTGGSAAGADAPATSPYMLGTMTRPDALTLSNAFQQLVNYTSLASPLPNSTAANFNQTDGEYKIVTTGIGDVQSITLLVTAEIENHIESSTNVDINIYKDDSYVNGISYTIPAAPSSTTPFLFNTADYFGLEYEAVLVGGLDANQEYTVKARMIQNPSSNVIITALNFSVSDQNPTQGPPDTAFDQTPYWETGSDYPQTTLHTWLTASSYLSQNYGRTQNSTPVQSLSENNYNLSPIEVPFIILPGDRIRFEYNKLNDYIIYDVITPPHSPDNLLKFKINENIPTNVNRDNFVIHRTNIDDPAYIILNINKNSLVTDTQNFNGVILPEFPTDKLKNNLDRITIELKERGIITDNET
tara:strand:- start:7 stop:1527 length:1521 start_codon:yes stop_codon:yes gene_type:complete